MKRAPGTAGFSLVELIVALGITLAVTAAIFDLVAQSRRSFDAEPEAADRRQRLRVAVDTLQRDLLMATVVMPYRTGSASPDPAGTFKDDVLTMVTDQASGPETVRTYYVRSDPASGSSQLMRAEGSGGDAPVADGVTTLSFAFYGNPALALNDPCTPSAFHGAVVPIAGSEFTDGPWCPVPGSTDPVDADLLRIRTVLVRVAVRAASGDLSFEVALRNRNQDR